MGVVRCGYSNWSGTVYLASPSIDFPGLWVVADRNGPLYRVSLLDPPVGQQVQFFRPQAQYSHPGWPFGFNVEPDQP